jgi:AraC family transcriptional regulator, dual regulator of chb operon
VDQDLTAYHRLTWASELPHGCVRVSRHVFLPEKRFEFGLHDHEFAEFLWVEFGRCEHLINGTSEILEPGDFRCIRPNDLHRPRSDGSARCAVVNISFLLEPLAALAERCGDDWPWLQTAPITGGRLSPIQRERLSAWVDVLSTPAPRQIDLDCFILDLTRMLSSTVGGMRAAGLPGWLGSAREIFAEPRHMCGGVPELARICGRSREHVNRVVRACQNRRATDLVNAIRLDWVAAQLHTTDQAIESLAADCGLPNLAHFYKLFRATFAVTPAEWRRSVRSAFPPSTAMNVAPWSA